MNEIEIPQPFDYSTLDLQTSEFLKSKESTMSEIVGKAYTELGRELKEAQDALSKQGYGCFEEWYTSLGFDRGKTYRLIGRYELILTNCEKQELIEDLPLSLSYEIAKPSANVELKQQVLSGEITTHKEYKKLEREKEAAELRAKQAEANHALAVKHNSEQAEKYQQQIDELKKSTAKDTPESLKKIKELEDKLKEYKLDAEQHQKLKKDILDLNTKKDDLNRQIESAVSLARLSVQIEEMLKTQLSPIRYSRALTEQRGSKAAMQNLSEIIEQVESWCSEIRSLMPTNYIDVEVIDA